MSSENSPVTPPESTFHEQFKEFRDVMAGVIFCGLSPGFVVGALATGRPELAVAGAVSFISGWNILTHGKPLLPPEKQGKTIQQIQRWKERRASQNNSSQT